MHQAGESLAVLLCPGRAMCGVRSAVVLGRSGWVPAATCDAVLHPGRLEVQRCGCTASVFLLAYFLSLLFLFYFDF